MKHSADLSTVDDHQRAKASAFRALHRRGLFVLPCAWDAGSAKLLSAAGFAAIGTTSGGVNWKNGDRDYVYSVPRDTMLAEYGAIASAVDLPVSGDLENGYGAQPEAVAETIQHSIRHGMVGGSIEDQASDGSGLFAIDHAAERIAAARAAANSMLSDFTLTARAESFYGGHADPMADAIMRANRYVEAGADCVFVPGPSTITEFARLVREIDAPISVGIGSGGGALTLAELETIGVRRVSTGGALPRALYSHLISAANEISAHGTFGFCTSAIEAEALEDKLDPAGAEPTEG